MMLLILISLLFALFLLTLYLGFKENNTNQMFYIEPGTVEGGWNFSDFYRNDLATDLTDYSEDSELYAHNQN